MNVKTKKSLGLIAVLYFTTGFQAQTVQDTLTKETKINEVVLIGYGSVKKKNVTSAIETIKSDAFENRPIYNVGQALQGNAAGVSVIQNSGKPGEALNVKIRGNNSITSGVTPLYVVDGIQTFDISGINTDDIAEMTILKDATSAAIYGINGSGGVVIITTKRARANKPQLNFNAYWGVSKQVDNVDVLNPEQYRTLMNEINPSYIETIDNARYKGINTDWKKAVYQTGFDQNYNVNYSFGDEKVRAYTGFGYQGINGIIAPSKFDRISAKINLDAKITNWLKVTSSMNYINTMQDNTADNRQGARGGVVLAALTSPTFMPAYGDQINFIPGDGVVYDNDGNIKDGYKPGQFAPNPFTAGWENPVSFQYRDLENWRTHRFLSNIGLEVNILKNLVYKPSLSFDYTDTTYNFFRDAYRSADGRNNQGFGQKTNSLYQDMNFENTLNYTFKSGGHDLGLLAGFQMYERNYQLKNYWGKGFELDQREFDYNLASVDKNEVFRKEIRRELSYFGRATYTLNGKYTVMGVFRYNGSSALAEGNKWGFLPGVSASWNIGNENFLADSKTISELKIRGGWGKTGNASGIPPYSHYILDRISHDSEGGVWNRYQWGSDIGWEITTDTNFGVDLGFASNRIKLTADFYKRKTDDLIMPIQIGQIGSILQNVGSMENKGMEFSLNTVNVKNGNFSWNSNFNISFNKNEVLSLKYMPVITRVGIEGMGDVVRFTVGQPLSMFYGYKVDRIDPATGHIIYQDVNGNGRVNDPETGYFDADDRTFIGNPNPDFTFGFTNNFTYKNWYLDVLITGSQGNDIYNATGFELQQMNDFKNQSTKVLNRWQNPGDITNVPKAGSGTVSAISDRYVEDGSFIKLKSATLGYNFNKPFKGVSKLNLYITGQNLYTWTDYSGFDPEVNSFSGNNGVIGVDYGAYPQVRTFIFGLKANF